MLGDLLVASSLVLIIEGLMPALSPRGWRSMVSQVADQPDRHLRIGGFVLILAGAVMFHLVS